MENLKQTLIEIRNEAEEKRDRQHISYVPIFLLGSILYFGNMYFYYL